MIIQNVVVFTATGTWFKPSGLLRAQVLVRGSGSNGAGAVGGNGGDLILPVNPLRHSDLPESVAVTVGVGGADSSFGDILSAAGGSNTFGVGILAGGLGGASGQPGKSTNAVGVRMVTGGGGGGGSGAKGGASGLVPGGASGSAGLSQPHFWQVSQSGSGGGAGGVGGYPSGGGGAGAAGAAGCVTVVETILIFAEEA